MVIKKIVYEILTFFKVKIMVFLQFKVYTRIYVYNID